MPGLSLVLYPNIAISDKPAAETFSIRPTQDDHKCSARKSKQTIRHFAGNREGNACLKADCEALSSQVITPLQILIQVIFALPAWHFKLTARLRANVKSHAGHFWAAALSLLPILATACTG